MTSKPNHMAMFSPDRDALLIDIDGTLTDWIGQPPAEGRGLLLGQSLLWQMREFAVQRNGMDSAEAERRIRHVLQTVRWWHWSDFLRELDLNGYVFWQFAYERESHYLGAIEDGLTSVFDRLHQAGYRMFITSNNPNTGILHKLRLAGLAEIYGSRYFLQYFCPCDLHYMKQDPEFWRRVLTHSGLSARTTIVIGDSWADDILAPQEAGIGRRIHLNIAGHDLAEHSGEQEGVWNVSNWQQITRLLLQAAPATKPAVINQ